VAALFFYASLSDVTDPYRLLHGKHCPHRRVQWEGAIARRVSVWLRKGAIEVLNATLLFSFSGLSQVSTGVSLYYLWQVIPSDNYYKKKDTVLPRNFK
jgi:hypothetical protein